MIFGKRAISPIGTAAYYNPTVNYQLNLIPQGPAITTVSAIEFCLVLYGTRGGTGVGPFTGLR